MNLKVRVFGLLAAWGLGLTGAAVVGVTAARADPPGIPYGCYVTGNGAASAFSSCSGGSGYHRIVLTCRLVVDTGPIINYHTYGPWVSSSQTSWAWCSNGDPVLAASVATTPA
jgi:hypothetical protein